MREVFKFFYDWYTGGFGLFENPIYDYLAMGLVLVIAFKIAFEIVGQIYMLDMIAGKLIGSVLHWIFRLLAFLVVFAIFKVVIIIIVTIISVPKWVWYIAIAIFIAIIIFKLIKNIIDNRHLDY